MAGVIAAGFLDPSGDLVKGAPAGMIEALAAAAPLGRMGQPSDIAGIAAFLASPARELDQRTDNPRQQRRSGMTTTHIEHEFHATIPAPIEAVWTLLGSFGDMTWNSTITDCFLVDGGTAHVGAIREMRTLDGTTIRERLDASGPDYSFTYSFDGVPPGPVSTSRTTVTATRTDLISGPATSITLARRVRRRGRRGPHRG